MSDLSLLPSDIDDLPDHEVEEAWSRVPAIVANIDMPKRFQKGSPHWWFHLPIKWQESQAFVAKHHRHSEPLKRHRFSIGMYDASTASYELIGVVTVDNCSSAWSKLYDHAEIRRLCVLPDKPNLASKLLRLATDACVAMGMKKIVSYTRPHESGSSLQAVGYHLDHRDDDRDLLRWIYVPDGGKFREYREQKARANTKRLLRKESAVS